MKIYVAGKLEEHARAASVMSELRKMGHTITHDWTPEAESGEDDPTLSLKDLYARKRKAAEEDLQGVLDADVLVFLYNNRCRGAFWEAGAAQKKPVHVSKTDGLSRSDVCFLWLPNVTVHTNDFDLLNAIRRLL